MDKVCFLVIIFISFLKRTIVEILSSLASENCDIKRRIVELILYNFFFLGPPILPIIGSYFYYKRANFHLFLDKLKLKYGPLISFAMYKRTYVFASSPEFILEILKRPEFQGRPKSFIRDSLFDTYHQGR